MGGPRLPGLEKPHPKLIDMTGVTINGCVVLARAGRHPRGGQAAWKVRASCGHDVVLLGTVLRQREDYGFKAYVCDKCSPNRRGRQRQTWLSNPGARVSGHFHMCDCEECLSVKVAEVRGKVPSDGTCGQNMSDPGVAEMRELDTVKTA